MNYFLVALYRDNHFEILYWSDDLDELLDDFSEFCRLGPSFFETVVSDYIYIRDVYVLKQLI